MDGQPNKFSGLLFASPSTRNGRSRTGLPLGFNLARKPSPAEAFFWLGWNYLRKMTLDLSFLPMPVGADPLLLNWFRYTSSTPRTEGWLSPPEGGEALETDWWFDAGRLHTPEDVARMKSAQQERRDGVRCSDAHLLLRPRFHCTSLR